MVIVTTTTTSTAPTNLKRPSIFGVAVADMNSSDEVTQYLSESQLLEETDVLQYWHSASTWFPVLSELALQTHSRPASSVECESVWSNSGFITSEKRRSLDSDSTSMLAFLYRNLRQMKILKINILNVKLHELI